MSLEITLQDHGELWAEAEQRLPPIVSADGLEIAYPMPPLLGDGYDRQIEIQPDVELCVFDGIYRQDVVLCIPENRHLVQFVVNLSGTVDSGEFGYRNAYRGYIGGSGIQQPIQTFIPQGQRLTRVNIHMQPQILAQFFGTVEGDLLPILDLLVPEAEQPQRVFSPLTTQAIRAVTQQIMHCRFTGITKRLYLQGKVLELIALQLAGVSSLGSGERALKPEMMAGVQRAAAVLRSNLENPPDQTALAQGAIANAH
ncbi:MAG: AraC family transcriptional regulator, partial [Cyanobacteria bacterium J06635_13]